MNNLQLIKYEFNANNLVKNQYTISLIKECVRIKIFDENIIYNVQLKVGEILKDLIIKYTRGESSSVTVEKAEKLIIAIWYTMDAYVSSFEDIEDSIAVIKNEEIKDIYDKGKEILKQEFNNSKKLYDDMIENKLDNEILAYNDTIKGIATFFEGYNMEFEPDEVPGSIDYPLAFDDWDIKGLYYIKNYIWNLYTENKICSHFEKKDIDNMLESYGNMYKIDYRDLLINIFELTVSNAVFCNICKCPSRKLVINEKDIRYLNKNLKNYEKKEIEKLIDLSIDKLIIDLEINDEYEMEYIERYKKDITKAVVQAINQNNLRNILVIEKVKQSSKSNFIIADENKLDDEEFRVIVHKLLECEDVFEKIEIINENINSIKDFIDILKSNCLFEDEYIQIFMSLKNIELAMLGKYVLYGEYRMEKLDLEKTLNNKIETHHEFEDYYLKFLRKLNHKKLKTIEDLIDDMN